MSKIKVNKRDKNRILLTEVLPYEVPICFSNEGFYKVIRENPNMPNLIETILKKQEVSIPFNYKIRKSNNSFRTLSIMHPSNQLKIVNFYEDYAYLITHLCSRSSLSLRAPKKIASHFYCKTSNDEEANVKNGTVETEAESNIIYSSSYFVYSKYNYLFKFYDSYDFLRLEKKYKKLLKFDISKCFNSIYTHSISWAVKDKKFAKANIGAASFEQRFDKLMQAINYNETNGILIGPEVSRIFAEIILQKIDVNAVSKLKSDNFSPESDFSVRRYVDDYFVFYNDDKVAEKVFNAFQQELEEYKMYLNDSKIEKLEIPLISGITISKIQIQKLFDKLFLSYILVEDVLINEQIQKKIFIKEIKRPNELANKLIIDIKCIIKSNCVTYDSITNYILSIIKKKLIYLVGNIKYKDLSDIERNDVSIFFLVIIDVLFFIYSMDTRVRTTYLMSQIIISLSKFFKPVNKELFYQVSKKIYDETIYLIKNTVHEKGGLSVEVLNILIALKTLEKEYSSIEVDTLINLLSLQEPSSKKIKTNDLNYFQITVLLFFIDNSSKYNILRKSVEDDVINQYKSEASPFIRADLTYLFFDFIKCPWVNKGTKKELIKICLEKQNGVNPNNQEINRIFNFITKYEWFFNWSSDISLEHELEKKELKTPYD